MLLFLLLTFVSTWTAFFAAAAMAPGSWQALALLWFGTFSPALVALGLVARESGSLGLRALGQRMVAFDVQWRWYVFALGYILSLKLVAAVLHRVLAGVWPAFGTEPWGLILLAIIFSAPLQAGEEIGWRGYALPRLAIRFGFARASVLLGFAWGTWHLPLFLLPAHANYGQSFWLFVIGSTALSIAMAWLFVHTRGSLALAMLMHSAVNQTNGVVPTRLRVPGNPFAIVDVSLIVLIFASLLVATAAYFLWRLAAQVSDSSRAIPTCRGDSTDC